jgi:hypothetical protein
LIGWRLLKAGMSANSARSVKNTTPATDRTCRPMPTPRPCRRRGPKPDRRRALELLASCRDGCTEAIMLAHGFSIAQMVELVRAGLATAHRPSARAGSLVPMEVTRVRITDTGRQALKRPKARR